MLLSRLLYLILLKSMILLVKMFLMKFFYDFWGRNTKGLLQPIVDYESKYSGNHKQPVHRYSSPLCSRNSPRLDDSSQSCRNIANIGSAGSDLGGERLVIEQIYDIEVNRYNKSKKKENHSFQPQILGNDGHHEQAGKDNGQTYKKIVTFLPFHGPEHYLCDQACHKIRNP